MGSLLQAFTPHPHVSSFTTLPPLARGRLGNFLHVSARVRWSSRAVAMSEGRLTGFCFDPSSFGSAVWDCGGRIRRPGVRAAAGEPGKDVGVGVGVGGSTNGQLILAAAVTIALAVINRVLYKLALVPMKDYPFFMAQLTTFGYVIIYFSILYGRRRSGIVTGEMLAIPKTHFLAIGFLEALGVASGMAAAAMLPGALIPILSQSFLVWQLVFSTLILGRKYSPTQIIGCLLVVSGVVTAVGSGTSDGLLVAQVGVVWPLLMVVSSAFQAGASIIKEFVFIDSSKRLQGKALDIFVVNSFGSGFQALFVLLLLPILSQLKGIPFVELPQYLRDGAGCFLNVGGSTAGCEGSPLLPLLYISANMAFNISALYLLKISSAIVSSLSTILAVPLSIYIFTLPLPYLAQGTNLDTYFLMGTMILMLGLLLYNLPQFSSTKSKID